MTALLILTYNNTPATIACLESIMQYNTAPVKFFVVDNGSSVPGAVDELKGWLQTHFQEQYLCLADSDAPCGRLPQMTLLASAVNDGYARGNNKGLVHLYADPEVEEIAILNNDILFVADILPELVSFLRKNERCGVVAPLLYKRCGVKPDPLSIRRNMSNSRIISRFGWHYPFFLKKTARDTMACSLIDVVQPDAESFPMEVPNGSFMMISKELMRRIEGFDPRTFLYYEENILYKKLSVLGYTNYCLPQLKAIHLGAETTRSSRPAFVMSCSFESADVYLRHYAAMTAIEHLRWSWVRHFFPLKLKAVLFCRQMLGSERQKTQS